MLCTTEQTIAKQNATGICMIFVFIIKNGNIIKYYQHEQNNNITAWNTIDVMYNCADKKTIKIRGQCTAVNKLLLTTLIMVRCIIELQFHEPDQTKVHDGELSNLTRAIQLLKSEVINARNGSNLKAANQWQNKQTIAPLSQSFIPFKYGIKLASSIDTVTKMITQCIYQAEAMDFIQVISG